VAAELQERANLRLSLSKAEIEMKNIKANRERERRNHELQPTIFQVGHYKTAIDIYKKVNLITRCGNIHINIMYSEYRIMNL